MQRAAPHTCLQTQQGPFAFDKGFPSEPDSAGSIKVMVQTWCLEASSTVIVMFPTNCSFLGSLLFFAAVEEWLKALRYNTETARWKGARSRICKV